MVDISAVNRTFISTTKKKMRNLLLALLAGLSSAVYAQDNPKADSIWMYKNYTKREVYIPMRDGQRLYTAIYEPKDKKSQHPIIINRTPYAIAPYGKDKFKAFWNTHYMTYLKKNYIYVLQDVRGRMMSEGSFVDVRPYLPAKQGADIDEASDTYDAIDWLIKNTSNNNGRVGIYGISYPGFYATMGALSQHPAMKAASPQAPVTDWWLGDDFHHNGAFMEMDAFNFYSIFGKPRPKPTSEWGSGFKYPIKDNYSFYLQTGALKNLAKLMGDSIAFWKDLYNHPNYDEWWQERNARKYVGQIPSSVATLVVGGLYDAEDCYGAWELYKAIERKAKNDNKLVMGPWSHGGWARGNGDHLGNVRFGSKTAKWYQQNIEIPFFEYHLNGKGTGNNLAEANVFFSGENNWHTYGQWPPANGRPTAYYLNTSGILSQQNSSKSDYRQYISDPQKPVPYTEDVHQRRTNEYMTYDQRFASRRPDVLTYTTYTLQEDVTLGGKLTAQLYASVSSTDADFIVKLIDVFPDDFGYIDSVDGAGNGKTYMMEGYQMLVRGEVMRGRYRNSFRIPEAFVPGRIEEVSFALPDVAHTFKKGHKIMIQVQSSWFPLVDRNPQQFVNIYTCDDKDFVPATVRIYCNNKYPSNVELPVLK